MSEQQHEQHEDERDAEIHAQGQPFDSEARDRTPGAESAVDNLAPLGASGGAAGGSVAVPGDASAPGVGDDNGPQITFGTSDDMGGVSTIGGGSFGDQDLSGRRSYDITADVYGGSAEDLLADGEPGEHVGPGSAFSGASSQTTREGATGPQQGHKAQIIDGGGDQGVIDPTIDPIEGPQIDPANDDSDPYVEGEVGAQAERDLDDLRPDHPELDGEPPRR